MILATTTPSTCDLLVILAACGLTFGVAVAGLWFSRRPPKRRNLEEIGRPPRRGEP